MAPLVSFPRGSCRTGAISGLAFATALAVGACGHKAALYDPTPDMLAAEAPDSFIVGVETSEGYFEIRIRRAWSPQAADRAYHLMDNNFYAGARIYRVVPGFVAQWGATLVQRVLYQVREDCIAAGLEAHWRVFEERVVRPLLHGQEPTPYSVLVEQLDLHSVSQAANMMITVKRRTARAMLREVGRTVQSPLHVEDELHDLLRELEATR